MRFQLHGYQTAAQRKIVAHLSKSFRDYADQDDRSLGAVCLAAPTGAGKTVISTAVVEELMNEDNGTGSNDAVFLWVTDDKSLNEQTRRKMLMASSSLSVGQLVTLENDFDEEVFPAGRVYFLNIQKLARTATLSREPGDTRNYSLWQTISNTIQRRPTNFYIIIDEAHKGMSVADRDTIVARIIGGGDTGRIAAPVVLGITATPDRFTAAMVRTGRSLKSHVVPVAEVRASGLLKNKIILLNPAERNLDGQSLILRRAVAAIQEYEQQWAEYAEKEQEPLVTPILVIQVPNSPSAEALRELLDDVFEDWPGISDQNVVNTFADHTTLRLGSYNIRYSKPEEIQDDEGIRVVLCKEAITTGWDCPRAEVLVSLRVAQDMDHITQIMGRMVRTPLARRVMTNESLNAVHCFLPKFDGASVETIAARFEAGEDGTGSGTETITKPIIVRRNANVDQRVFSVIQNLPSYVIGGQTYRSQVDRLMGFAVLLEGRNGGKKLEINAVQKAASVAAAPLVAKHAQMAAEGTLKAAVRNITTMSVEERVASLDASATEAPSGSTFRIELDADGLAAQYRRAAGLVGPPVAQSCLTQMIAAKGDELEDVTPYMMEVAAAALEFGVADDVERAASLQTATWLKMHREAISKLPASVQDKFDKIRREAKDSEESAITIPERRTEQDGERWASHLLCADDGTFPAELGDWEKAVLRSELRSEGFITWYRNPTGGERALRIPYVMDGVERALYPDFIFFHEVEDKVVSSIVDPHGHHLSDAVPKLRGLASYASTHGEHYDRIHAVIKHEDKMMSLDLLNEDIRDFVDSFTGDSTLPIFLEHATKVAV